MHPKQITRRWFFEQCGVGLGAAALATCSPNRVMPRPSVDPLAPKQPHFAPKAKNVIFLFMAGAPEPPRAVRQQAAAREIRRNTSAGRTVEGLPRRVHQSQFEAARTEVQVSAKLRPERHRAVRAAASHRQIVDEIAIVKSMVTDAFNHAPGQLLMNTGTHAVRPSEHGRLGALRAWARRRRICPAFVVFSSGTKGPSGGDSCWGSGFLPTVYQGVQFRSGGDPVLYLSNPHGVDKELQRDSLDAVKQLNQMRLEKSRRSRDRDAHQFVRDGVPDASGRARVDGHLQGAQADD